MAKIKFSEIELKDLEGKKIEETNLHQAIANMIYKFTKDLGLVKKAMDIYAGKEVELTAKEIEEVTRLVEEGDLMAFAKAAVMDALKKA